MKTLVIVLTLAGVTVPQSKTKTHELVTPQLTCQTFYTLPHRYPDDVATYFVPLTERHQPPKTMHKHSQNDAPDFKRISPPKTWELEIRGYGTCDFHKTKPPIPPWFKVSKIDVRTPNLAVVTVDASNK